MKLSTLEVAVLEFVRGHAERILNIRSERYEAMNVTKAQIAQKMLEHNMPVDDIVALTGLEKDDIDHVKSGLAAEWRDSGDTMIKYQIREALEFGLKTLARKWLREGLSEKLVMEYLDLEKSDIRDIRNGSF